MPSDAVNDRRLTTRRCAGTDADTDAVTEPFAAGVLDPGTDIATSAVIEPRDGRSGS
jgi:hypothetical protein